MDMIHIPDDIGGSDELITEATLMEARRVLEALRSGGDEFGIVADAAARIARIKEILRESNPEVRGAMVLAGVVREVLEDYGHEVGIEVATMMSVTVALLEEDGETKELNE